MSKARLALRPGLEGTDSEPSRTLDLHFGADFIPVGAARCRIVFTLPGLDHLTVSDQLEVLDRRSAEGGGSHAECCRFIDLKVLASTFAINLDEQHWTGGDEAASLVERAQPAPGSQLAVQANVDAAVAERDGMDSGGRAGRWAQAEATVEKSVVALESVIYPTPLRPSVGIALDLHVGRGRLSPAGETEFCPPDVIVRELKKIDVHERDQGDGPRPSVFVQFKQSSLATGFLRNWGNRWDAPLKRAAVSDDEEGTEGVSLAFDGEDLILRVAWPDNVACVEPDLFGRDLATHAAITHFGGLKRPGNPVHERK